VKSEIEKIKKIKEELIMFELEYLKRYSYFQTNVMLLSISIIFASIFYLLAYIQNSFLLKLLVPISFTPIILYLSFQTYKDATNLINLLNDKMKELKLELKGGRQNV
jgi:hypothetical protein